MKRNITKVASVGDRNLRDVNRRNPNSNLSLDAYKDKSSLISRGKEIIYK